MGSITNFLSPSEQLITHGAWALWFLFWGVLMLSVCQGGVRAIFYFVRFVYQRFGIYGIIGGLALVVLAGMVSSGAILGLLTIIGLGGGALYYTFDFWFMQFPGYFRVWRKLPLATRVLSLVFPYDLVFSLLKPMVGY